MACYLCNKNLDGWEATDDAWQEHTKHAAQCPLVRLDTTGGRQATFSNSWPHGATLSPTNMVRAGFFYWPKLQPSKGYVDDTCVCFQCGLALDGWEEGDDPQVEHSKRRPGCPFISKGVALHPCSFEFILGSKPDTNAVTHISASTIKCKEPKENNKKNLLAGARFRLPTTKQDAIAKPLAETKEEKLTIQHSTFDFKEKENKRPSPEEKRVPKSTLGANDDAPALKRSLRPRKQTIRSSFIASTQKTMVDQSVSAPVPSIPAILPIISSTPSIPQHAPKRRRKMTSILVTDDHRERTKQQLLKPLNIEYDEQKDLEEMNVGQFIDHLVESKLKNFDEKGLNLQKAFETESASLIATLL